MNERPFRFIWLDVIRSQVRTGALTNNAGHLALMLAVHYINGGSNQAWPSQQQLAADAGVSQRTVRNALRELEQNGYLTITRGRSGGRITGNVYQLENRSN